MRIFFCRRRSSTRVGKLWKNEENSFRFRFTYSRSLFAGCVNECGLGLVQCSPAPVESGEIRRNSRIGNLTFLLLAAMRNGKNSSFHSPHTNIAIFAIEIQQSTMSSFVVSICIKLSWNFEYIQPPSVDSSLLSSEKKDNFHNFHILPSHHLVKVLH